MDNCDKIQVRVSSINESCCDGGRKLDFGANELHNDNDGKASDDEVHRTTSESELIVAFQNVWLVDFCQQDDRSGTLLLDADVTGDSQRE